MTELEKQLLEALEACIDDSRECLKELKQNCGGDFGHHCIAEQTRLVEKAELAIAAAEAAQPAYDVVQLAEMILSDCGYSTAISNRVQLRVADRIQAYVDQLLGFRPQPAPGVPDTWVSDLKIIESCIKDCAALIPKGMRNDALIAVGNLFAELAPAQVEVKDRSHGD
ncbi:hypothetical protein [Chromobacterium haemolyticum]|uniref:hypothetical protein n=1 Tax=Chromobacterium haemolyticum TaxID=394935 RepID=UPI000592A6AA|nr:hypothetical protein [Chromobacterium haemolyticum]